MNDEEKFSALVIGALMAVFALIGLMLASHALDVEMSIFGWSLAAFAFVFLFGLIRRHFDQEAAAKNEEVRRHG